MINAPQMRALCERLYYVMVEEVFPDRGIQALFSVLETVTELYKRIEPSRINGGIVVFQEVADVNPPIALTEGELCGDLDLLIPRATSGLLLGIRGDGRRYLYATDSVTAAELARAAVVYEFRGNREQFYAGSKSENVLPLVPEAVDSIGRRQKRSFLRWLGAWTWNAFSANPSSCVR